MSNAQFRVLALLLTALGIDLVFNPLTNSAIYMFTKNAAFKPTDTSKPLIDQVTPSAVGIFVYFMGIVLFLSLADGIPTITTWVAVLILALSVLRHGNQIVVVFSTAATGLNTLRGGS